MSEEKSKRELVFRLFEAHEIQVRAGQKTKKGDKIALLLYQDARAAMNRLDEKFGEYGWQREHKDVHGVTYCGVSLWSDEKRCWVTKWDAGEPSNTSPQKGEASDSFKRACVNWGIGRELYTAPRMYVPIETDTFGLSVQSIKYNEKREITALTIADAKGNIIYPIGRNNAGERKETAKEPVQAKPAQAVSTTDPADKAYLEAYAACSKARSCDELKLLWNKYKGEAYANRLGEKVTEILRMKGWA